MGLGGLSFDDFCLRIYGKGQFQLWILSLACGVLLTSGLLYGKKGFDRKHLKDDDCWWIHEYSIFFYGVAIFMLLLGLTDFWPMALLGASGFFFLMQLSVAKFAQVRPLIQPIYLVSIFLAFASVLTCSGRFVLMADFLLVAAPIGFLVRISHFKTRREFLLLSQTYVGRMNFWRLEQWAVHCVVLITYVRYSMSLAESLNSLSCSLFLLLHSCAIYLNANPDKFRPPFLNKKELLSTQSQFMNQLRAYYWSAFLLVLFSIFVGGISLIVKGHHQQALIIVTLGVALNGFMYFRKPESLRVFVNEHESQNKLMNIESVAFHGSAIVCYAAIIINVFGALSGPAMTIALVLHAIYLIFDGAKLKNQYLTKFSISLFAVAVFKLIFHDMRDFTLLNKIVAFMVIGSVLLVAAYRFQKNNINSK